MLQCQSTPTLRSIIKIKPSFLANSFTNTIVNEIPPVFCNLTVATAFTVCAEETARQTSFIYYSLKNPNSCQQQ